MKGQTKNYLLSMGGVVIFLICIAIFLMPFLFKTSYSVESKDGKNILSKEEVTKEEPPQIVHVTTPDAVKAIYMTACVAGTPKWREQLKNLIKTTELNSVVIDIKDSTGSISFVNDSLQKDHGNGCVVKDMKEFIEELHEDSIYVIGRISTFQDPLYTKTHQELAVRSYSTGGVWKDRKGLSFVDVGAKDYWDHIVDIAKASHEIGFDEINFDYIRYPSDGNMKDAHYTYTVGTSTKSQMVEKFFSYLHNQLKDTGMKTSADLFGLVTVATDDLGIGQVLEKALPYFDYIYPMVYPSHFGPGSAGYSKPAEHPYEIIDYSMSGAIKKEIEYRTKNGISTTSPSQIKPWLQDFDLGTSYGVPEVRAQIKATYNNGIKSWLVWDAGNTYTEGAFLAD
jgi:hypothetical protein